ncbi:MAG TPA: hypothetical protein DD405_06275 [Desulfobacteraceae bacterium]|nr:hypothetical protein [Desulfobacteraceae bacterium]
MKSKKLNEKEGKLFFPELAASVKKGCFIFAVSAFMFTAGVMVGRGTFPVTFDHNSLQNELFLLEQADSETDIETTNIISAKSRDTDEIFKKKEGSPVKKPGTGSIIHKNWKSLKKKTYKPGKKAIPPKEISLKKQIKGKNTNQYIVQIAASKDFVYADELVVKLKQKGFNGYIVKAKVTGKGIFYRVRVGFFDNRKDASALLNRLKKEKIFGYITQKQE